MRAKLYLIIALVLFFVLSGGAPVFCEVNKPLTLDDCYVLALKQSEIIAIDGEKIKEAEAHFLQALAQILPHFSFSSKDFMGEPASTTTRGATRKFVLTQTLFSGFKEFAAMSGGHLERGQRESEKLRAEQLLFSDVSDAFYLLMAVREDIQSLRMIRYALRNRIKELVDREKLGRSRRSEVVNTEAQFYALEADIELAKSQEIVASQLLEFLIGHPVGEVVDAERLSYYMRPESEYTSKAENRPDVQAAKNSWEVAKKAIIVARSGFFPSVSLENNNYVDAVTNAKWDLALKVDVPIFDGAQTFGNVKLAGAQAREAELTWKRTKRISLQEIKEVYARLEQSLFRLKALEKALAAAEMNYALQKKDYLLSLVNNIVVLDAIQVWQEARRNYFQGLYNTKRLYWQLKVVSGETLLGG